MKILTKAILENDQAKVEQLLHSDTGLANRTVDEDNLYEEIAHGYMPETLPYMLLLLVIVLR
jgi:hypothetical protein